MRKIISLIFILAIFAVMFGGGGSFAATVEATAQVNDGGAPLNNNEPVSTDESTAVPKSSIIIPIPLSDDSNSNEPTLRCGQTIAPACEGSCPPNQVCMPTLAKPFCSCVTPLPPI